MSSNQKLPCPICQRGMYLPGRSLSCHLATCEGALLWNSFPQGQNNNKRVHDEMANRPMTNAARANAITQEMRAPQEAGTTRTADHLSTMPPLSHLASTQQNNTYHYNNNNNSNNNDMLDFGSDDVVFEDNVNAPPDGDTNATAANDDIELNPFRRNVPLPPNLVFQVHMENVITSHRNVDLNLSNEINDCIQYHAQSRHLDFATTKLYPRTTLITKITDAYNLHGLKPTLNRVLLSDQSYAVVPTFDVKTMLLSLLNDPSRMKKENMAPNYDAFTGKSIDASTHLDEVHTGWAWEAAREHYCGDDPDVFPLGLIGFYDKTHTDVFGSLSSAPFIVVPSCFNESCRNNVDFYTTLGYIPNLGHGKGKSSGQSSKEKLQDEHNCLKLITSQLKKLQEEGGFWTVIMGRRVRVVVWLHFIAGDTSGHNNLVGHYNANGDTNCPYRCCKCSMCDMANSIAECVLITLQDMELDEDGLKGLSKHKISNAFANGVPLSDLLHGIAGIVPAEMLHVSGNGLIKYQLECVHDLIGPKQSKKKEKDLFDALYQTMVNEAARQSERDFPRFTNRNGILDGTKMGATERVGTLMILLTMTYTTEGAALLQPGWSNHRHRITKKAFQNCIKLQLGFEKWVNESNTFVEVKNSDHLLSELIEAIKHCFPRDRGNGWKIPKIHSLAKMTYYMLKFGKARNFSGQIGESALKGIVKDHATRTQRRADNFAQQVALRESESLRLEWAYEDIKPMLGLNFVEVNHMNPSQWSGQGTYTATFFACDTQGRSRSVQVDWDEKNKDLLAIGLQESFLYAIRAYACANGWIGQMQIRGWTRFKMCPSGYEDAVLFHASEYLYGRPWYDYAMVQFAEDNTPPSETITPARVLGFFRYETPGIPTPGLINDQGMSADEIEDQWATDSDIYAVVHTATSYIPWSKIETDFVVPFQLGEARTHIFIVKAGALIDPLYVFKDYGGNSDRYFCSLPYRKWGRYFGDRVVAQEEAI